MGGKVPLLAFRQILTKILPAACIQLRNYILVEKARLILSPLIQNCVKQDYLPESRASISFHNKNVKNCCTHQVWTVPLSPEPLWEALGMMENPTQHPKMYSSSPSEKSPLIDLNLLILKVLFLPHQIAIFKQSPYATFICSCSNFGCIIF